MRGLVRSRGLGDVYKRREYDAKMGDTKARYKSVIFNPVPGPPMGANTRLSFRYKLSGMDTLRVQLFSLSNGYHRYLTLTILPQDKWSEATVDLTDSPPFLC